MCELRHLRANPQILQRWRRAQKSDENCNDDGGVIPPRAQINRATWISSLVPSRFWGLSWKQSPAGEPEEGTGRCRVKSEVPRLRTKARPIRFQQASGCVQLRTKPKAGRPRPTSTIPEPRGNSPDPLLACKIPAWKRLVDCPLASDECMSLIEAIFSNHYETEVVKRLRGKDAQTFVDRMGEVTTVTPSILEGH